LEAVDMTYEIITLIGTVLAIPAIWWALIQVVSGDIWTKEGETDE